MTRGGDHARHVHPKLEQVTARIVNAARPIRTAYLSDDGVARRAGPAPRRLSCGNLGARHGRDAERTTRSRSRPSAGRNLGIVTAYNDMLSAHQPYERYPDLIKRAARAAGAHGAGGRRRAGDVRRRHPGPAGHGAVAVLARRDRARDGGGAVAQRLRRASVLGVCDKIVPGLVIARGNVRPPAGGLPARRAR